MYNNLIYFLLVLLIWTTAPVSEHPPWPTWVGLILVLTVYLVYWIITGLMFRRFARALARGLTGSSGLYFSRASGRLQMLGLLFFAGNVYLFELKGLVAAVPLVGRSELVSGLLGLGAFALFLVLLWARAHQAYRRVFGSNLNRTRYIISQLRFNLPIILPYLLVSAIWDLLDLLPRSFLTEWLDTPLGESVFVLIFMFGLVALFPLLVRPLWGLKPLPEGEQRRFIENFCRDNRFLYREIMLWPLYEGEALTAGVMGLISRWRYILITKSLLAVLSPEELKAVLGHELGHVRHRHLFIYFFFFAGFMVVAYAFTPLPLLVLPFIPGAMGLLDPSFLKSTTDLSILLGIPVFGLMILYFRFILGWFLRNYERQADAFAFSLTGTIRGLVGSLNKIAFHSGQSRDLPSWHHFSVAQRVDFLEQCEQDPSLVERHNAKLRRMFRVYVLVVALVGLGGWQLQSGDFFETARQGMVVEYYQDFARRNPDNAAAQHVLGVVFSEVRRYDEAIDAFERSLALNPDDPESLNGLAWTLVTRPAPTATEKQRALALATEAARLKTVPHILDTLAETLYVNDHPRAAVEVIDRALALAGPEDDPDYLNRQKEKFEAALR